MSAPRGWGVWGVGPRIVLVSVAVYVALVILVAALPWLRFGGARPPLVDVLAWALLVGALVVWVLAIRRMRASYGGGYLETEGMFAWVRNPIYSAFIFVECPGLALLLWAWPGLALPFIAYALYRLWIPAEEDDLRVRFGPVYDAYRRRVPALLPRRPRQSPPGVGGREAGRGVGRIRRPRAGAPARRRSSGRSRSHLRGL